MKAILAMKFIEPTKSTLTAFCLWALATTVQAGWMLNAGESDFNFASIKKGHIYETHTFNRISGQIGDGGEAELKLDLTSVNTGIGIRDERMQAMLFDTSRFTSAAYRLNVDAGSLNALASGAKVQLKATGKLSLFGVEKEIPAVLNIYKLADRKLLVTTAQPVVVIASDFGMDSGVEALREIAGLPAISQAVPVNFSLVFDLQ